MREKSKSQQTETGRLSDLGRHKLTVHEAINTWDSISYEKNSVFCIHATPDFAINVYVTVRSSVIGLQAVIS